MSFDHLEENDFDGAPADLSNVEMVNLPSLDKSQSASTPKGERNDA